MKLTKVNQELVGHQRKRRPIFGAEAKRTETKEIHRGSPCKDDRCYVSALVFQRKNAQIRFGDVKSQERRW